MMRSGVLFVCLLLFSQTTCAEEQSKRGKWYVTSAVGFHHHGSPEPTLLEEANCAKYFTGKSPFLSDAYRKEVLPRLLASNKPPKFDPKKHIPPTDRNCFAQVSKFNEKELFLKVLRPLGGWRWHHHFQCLAIYRVNRNQKIDAIFNLERLYAKLSYTYKGIGHGMIGPDLRAEGNEVVEKLGKPDSIYPSQSPSLGRYYYKKHDLHIETHHFRIYFVEKGKPTWVPSLEAEVKLNKSGAGPRTSLP